MKRSNKIESLENERSDKTWLSIWKKKVNENVNQGRVILLSHSQGWSTISRKFKLISLIGCCCCLCVVFCDWLFFCGNDEFCKSCNILFLFGLLQLGLFIIHKASQSWNIHQKLCFTFVFVEIIVCVCC